MSNKHNNISPSASAELLSQANPQLLLSPKGTAPGPREGYKRLPPGLSYLADPLLVSHFRVAMRLSSGAQVGSRKPHAASKSSCSPDAIP